MKASWYPTAPILAVLAIPFGLAVYDDAVNGNTDESVSRFDEYDPYEDDYDYDYDDSYNRDPSLEELEEVEASKSVMEDAFFNEVFFSGEGESKPVMSGKLAELRFGDARLDESSALVRWSDYGDSPYREASLYLGYAENRLTDVTVSFVDDGTAIERFERHWGEPDAQGEEYGSSRALWLDRDRKVSVLVQGDTSNASAAFMRYLPLEELVAPDRKKGLGIGKFPILGSGRTAVLAQYKDVVDPYATDEYGAYLTLPRTEYSGLSKTSVQLSFDENRVDGIELSLDFGLKPEAASELVPLFQRKLGKKPTIEDEYGQTVARFSGKPSVVISLYEAGATVQIRND